MKNIKLLFILSGLLMVSGTDIFAMKRKRDGDGCDISGVWVGKKKLKTTDVKTIEDEMIKDIYRVASFLQFADSFDEATSIVKQFADIVLAFEAKVVFHEVVRNRIMDLLVSINNNKKLNLNDEKGNNNQKAAHEKLLEVLNKIFVKVGCQPASSLILPKDDCVEQIKQIEEDAKLAQKLELQEIQNKDALRQQEETDLQYAELLDEQENKNDVKKDNDACIIS